MKPPVERKCPMKILIVDGSRVMRRRLITSLSHLSGVEVIGEASDPLKAISCIRELKPDAVILDIRNQKRNGIDVLQNIRKNDPAPMVLSLTNDFYPRQTKRNTDETADLAVDKFVGLNNIREALNQLAQSSGSERVGVPSI